MTIDPDEVFIAGGLPDDTYVSRADLNLEESIQKWLKKKQKPILSLAGPTKSGKTVLLKKLIQDGLWISGGAIDTAEDFWNEICTELEVFTTRRLESTTYNEAETSTHGEASVGVATAGGEHGRSKGTSRGASLERSTSARSAARRALKQMKPVLIIDDFHYVEPEEQLAIVRGLKDLIFEGLSVVVAAVPHRAYDVVRVEKEMTARVEQLLVKHWTPEDLRRIAAQGFHALGVDDPEAELGKRLAEESFGSPFLMQTHCLNLCIENTTESVLPAQLQAPEWTRFFQRQATSTSKSAFELLKRGRRQRRDRIQREMHDGTTTDIYGAILAAIERTGPRTTLSYEDLRASLRQILASSMPQRHEVTNVLEQMTAIAKDVIEGEPVLEYDSELSELHLVDPFFAYYIRWASTGEKNLDVVND